MPGDWISGNWRVEIRKIERSVGALLSIDVTR
jgi:hypothetical protein